MDRDRPERFLPLKPLVLEILLGLAEGKRHGWSLVRDIQERGERVLPGNFYRTLRSLREDGLIEEAPGHQAEDPAERRQYFNLTTLGTNVVRAEVGRMKALVEDRRIQRLLRAR